MRPLDLRPYMIANPGRDLARIGVAKRESERVTRQRRMHRQMCIDMGRPVPALWEPYR